MRKHGYRPTPSAQGTKRNTRTTMKGTSQIAGEHTQSSPCAMEPYRIRYLVPCNLCNESACSCGLYALRCLALTSFVRRSRGGLQQLNCTWTLGVLGGRLRHYGTTRTCTARSVTGCSTWPRSTGLGQPCRRFSWGKYRCYTARCTNLPYAKVRSWWPG